MFDSEFALEDRLTMPSAALVASLASGAGDLVVLGAGGKMGPTLCRLARRGLDAAGRTGDAVWAVSRWSDPAAARDLERHGVRTVTFDLMGNADLSALPDARDVVFMVGAKFGTAAAPYLAWVVNAALPARVAERYAGARIAAFSTGNVYPLTGLETAGCAETDPPGPVGEYAMSCLGRERVFEHAAGRGTPVSLLRLNYAVDLRYGVLADIGQTVLSGAPVDVTTGHVNVVWQGYANEVALRSLEHAAANPFVVNITGPETASVRRIASRFAERFGVAAEFTGTEARTALLSDATRCHALFGYPDVPLGTLVEWQADWLARGLPVSGKPTKFAVRDGRF
ncbi:epimerase [Microbispora sp. NBRC 16548]|uniref:NAD-dependent epimerase/dehydratase family protein n=1 Tax=Microbispora sp. NBRC 16548 TaxID=3030994 RepID=UPI0024A4EB88|nr:epimerase [Microbispora sp. NBRC 16548]GLX10802.1 epimerase [Microbispora sp. NBRC 16548]